MLISNTDCFITSLFSEVFLPSDQKITLKINLFLHVQCISLVQFLPERLSKSHNLCVKLLFFNQMNVIQIFWNYFTCTPCILYFRNLEQKSSLNWLRKLMTFYIIKGSMVITCIILISRVFH